VDTLFAAGRIRDAYLASAKAIEPLAVLDDPYRGTIAPLDTARRWHDHGTLCWQAARFPEAATALRHAYAMRRRLLGADHADTLDTLERQAALAHYVLDERATAWFEQVIAGFIALHGADHVRVAVARRNFAAALRDTNQMERAREQIDRATEVIERELPSEHPDVIAALKVDAMIHLREKSYSAALRLADRAVSLGKRVWDSDHAFVVAAEMIVGSAEMRLGMHRQAAKRLARVRSALAQAYGEHPLVAIAYTNQATCELSRNSNLQRAEELARTGLAMYRRTYPDRGGAMAWTLFEILYAANRLVDAGELANEVDQLVTPRTRQAMAARLANAFVRLGEYKGALPWLERARDASESDDVRAKWAAQLDKWSRYVRRFEPTVAAPLSSRS
jgi:tetratricopeptide (TPR) repeat protein